MADPTAPRSSPCTAAAVDRSTTTVSAWIPVLIRAAAACSRRSRSRAASTKAARSRCAEALVRGARDGVGVDGVEDRAGDDGASTVGGADDEPGAPDGDGDGAPGDAPEQAPTPTTRKTVRQTPPLRSRHMVQAPARPGATDGHRPAGSTIEQREA